MAKFNFDDSGNVKSSPSLFKADKTTSIIALSTGTTASGQPYYAYIAVQPSKYREFFERSKARESIRIGDYGSIITHGFEKNPPADVAQRMKAEYGFDENYEARLQQEITAERKAHNADSEEKRLMDIVAMMKKQQQ